MSRLMGRPRAVEGWPTATNNDRPTTAQRCANVDRPRSLRTNITSCANKRQEWEEYRSEVTAFELRKNLPVL